MQTRKTCGSMLATREAAYYLPQHLYVSPIQPPYSYILYRSVSCSYASPPLDLQVAVADSERDLAVLSAGAGAQAEQRSLQAQVGKLEALVASMRDNEAALASTNAVYKVRAAAAA